MFAGHDPGLVVLSVAVAILGGYTGFGLAARIRATPGARPRALLAGAAVFLAVSIWTMHFIGMLAAPIPAGAVYLVLPTIVSFLICALVVGVSLFFVSLGEPSRLRLGASAALLGVGIVSMHYVGIHALVGDFHIHHDPAMIAVAGLIAVGTAFGGLRIFLGRQGGRRLALSAIAFGLAVSGMHYTAMAGMRFLPDAAMRNDPVGLSTSPQVLAPIIALLCFFIAAAFLLLLVPEPLRTEPAGDAGQGDAGAPPAAAAARLAPAPASRVPVEGPDGTHFIAAPDVRSIRADAHYSRVHDGARERMSPWSISEAEAQLDPAAFLRVHRSHIVAIAHVSVVRKEGDGAVVELRGAEPHRVPVSRARIAELKARLGLSRRDAS